MKVNVNMLIYNISEIHQLDVTYMYFVIGFMLNRGPSLFGFWAYFSWIDSTYFFLIKSRIL